MSKLYLCVLGGTEDVDVLAIIDPVSMRLAASTQYSASVLSTAAQQELLPTLVGMYPTPVQFEAPGPQLIGVNSSFQPIYLQTVGVTQTGMTTSTLAAIIFTLTADSYTVQATHYETYDTPTVLPNAARFLGSDGTTAYVAMPKTGEQAQVLTIDVNGNASVAGSPTLGSPTVAGVVNDGAKSYPTFGIYPDSASASGALWKQTDVWARAAQNSDAWDVSGGSSPYFPLAVPAALAATAGITPVYYAGRMQVGNTNEGPRYSQGYSSEGRFRFVGTTLTDVDTSVAVDITSMLVEAAGAGATATDRTGQAFVWMADIPLPVLAFWQNLIECDEI